MYSVRLCNSVLLKTLTKQWTPHLNLNHHHLHEQFLVNNNKSKLQVVRWFQNNANNGRNPSRRITSTLHSTGYFVSYGGTTGTHDNTRDLSKMKRSSKEIVIRFNADRSSSLMWNFRPEQAEIIVTPGETALAFYRAENKTAHPVDGISTYNVIPFEAGQYFNKIQCFCFEEQRLNPGEIVELPVFFYIDPEFTDDPKMEYVDMITLSYTFFESKEMPGGWTDGIKNKMSQHGLLKT